MPEEPSVTPGARAAPAWTAGPLEPELDALVRRAEACPPGRASVAAWRRLESSARALNGNLAPVVLAAASRTAAALLTGELLPEALETVLEAKPGLARVFLPGSPECVFAAETLALCRLKLLDEDSGTLADSWADAVAPGTRSRVTPDAEGLSVRRCAAETVFLAGRAASKTLRAISEFAEESGGPLCPLALRSRRCLAEALAILGDRGEAVKVYDELYVTLLFLKGPSSPDAMAVMADGAAAELESLFAEKGPCDLLTLEAALRLAESLVLLDREESRHLAQQVLETLETSGSRSGDMAARAKELASISRLS